LHLRFAASWSLLADWIMQWLLFQVVWVITNAVCFWAVCLHSLSAASCLLLVDPALPTS
jgi:hypothetical protein